MPRSSRFVPFALALLAAGSAHAQNQTQCTVDSCGLFLPNGTSTCSGSRCRTLTGCACDSVCEQYGDCCANFVPVCTAPRISALSPSPLPTASVRLTISGAEFDADAGTVVLAGQACPVVSWSPSQIVCTAPEGQGASSQLAVTDARGLQGSTLVVRRAPTLNGYSGPGIPTAGGAVLLQGTDFGSQGASVTTNVGTVQAWTQDTVTWNAPPGVTSASVSVTVSGQPSNALTVPYRAPSITDVAPASVPAGGAVITISGANFGASATTVTATVGGSPCANPAVIIPHSVLTCTAPSGLVGTVPVRVTVAGSTTSTPGSVTYPGPSIGSVNPPMVPTSGGRVTFTGSGLDVSGNVVTVGGIVCPAATSPTATSWACDVPAGVGRELAVSLNGVVQAPTVSYAPPVIVDLSPQNGSTAGGISITITGSNFSSQSAQNVVFVGGSQCAVSTPSTATELICTLPPGSGTRDVTVLVGGQTSNVRTYTYAAATVNSLSASNGATVGGATLTISGSNFGTQGASVRVGGRPCPVSNQQNARILCTLPPGVGGTVDAELTIGSQLLTRPFTWDPPSIASISPAVPTRGAARITITGANFGSGEATSVSMGGQSCDLSSRGHTELVCSAPPGQGTVAAVVTVAGATASRMYAYAPPSISTVSPTRARTTGGTILTIVGDSFGTTQGAVTLGGAPCALRDQGHTVVRCDAPAGEGANLPLVVRVGTVASASFAYSYEAPVIDLLQPTVMPTRGGFVWVSGRNFGQAPSVTVGGAACPVLKSTDTDLLCAVPATTSTANVDVVVTASGQTSNPVTLGRQGSCGAELAEGAACDDGVPCTGPGRCVGTTCVRGAANDEGVACDDGDPCTLAGTCRSGVCSAAGSLDGGQRCASASPCSAAGSCLSGACEAMGAREGLSCDDGDATTSEDVCTQARCAGDAGVLDAGLVDAGAPDAGAVDGGEVDAGEVDAGAVDAGLVDAGEVDAGEADAGAPDAGVADAGSMAPDGGDGEMPPPTGCGCSAVEPSALLGALLLFALRRRRGQSAQQRKPVE